MNQHHRGPCGDQFPTKHATEVGSCSTLASRCELGSLDVSKNRGISPPKWMVKIMENPIGLDDLGVPLFLETPTFKTKACKFSLDSKISVTLC